MRFNSLSATKLAVIGALAGAAFAPAVQAADWSDTSIGVRYGSTFAEPFRNNDDGDRLDIKKVIVNLTNVTGFKYGTTFINVDFLESDKNDPTNGTDGNAGAQEVYAVFRTTFDLAKITGLDFKMLGVVRDLGVTAGFDINTKNDFYASKKRMLVAGPTVMFDVPGFLNLSVLLFDESNASNTNVEVGHRYHYDNHATLEADWGLPIGTLPLSFNGYAQFIGSKGKDETGAQTSPETHLDMDLMLDLSSILGTGKKSTYIGVEYEYWHNKFGNPTKGDEGATASTPMVRAEYHF